MPLAGTPTLARRARRTVMAARLSDTYRLAQVSVSFRLHLPDVVAIWKKGSERAVTHVPECAPQKRSLVQANVPQQQLSSKQRCHRLPAWPSWLLTCEGTKSQVFLPGEQMLGLEGRCTQTGPGKLAEPKDPWL